MISYQLSIVFFSVVLCVTWGWEPGTQYDYKFTGRSAAGIPDMKQQHAIIEVQSRIVVQSHDENTIFIKLTEGKWKRNGSYEWNPYLSDDRSTVVPDLVRYEIDGTEDKIPQSEFLTAPFIVKHNKGAFTGIQIGADEPLWIVNFKKSIASQLQIDFSGSRPDGPVFDWSFFSNEYPNAAFTVFEDGVTGDCSTTISLNRLTASQVYDLEAFDLGSFEATCADKPVYEVIKAKDFNRCKTNPVYYNTNPTGYTCTLGTSACEQFMQRNSLFKYVACGETPSKLTYIWASGYGNLQAKPFATETEKLVNSIIINWSLEKTEAISSRFASPTNVKEHKTLAYVFAEIEQLNSKEETSAEPSLTSALLKSPIPVVELQKNVLEALRVVTKDLKDKPDSEQDNLERLAVIGRTLPMFSFDELRDFWEQIKKENYVVVTLFVDCLVQSGTNPAVMLVKELVESQQITGAKALTAVAALGYHIKTPTKELLHELITLLKSRPMQSSKQLKQTTILTVADLLNKACDEFYGYKRYAGPVMGQICDHKDFSVTSELLSILVEELKLSKSGADRIIALTAFGSLGVEEIIPELLPYIRGQSGVSDDTAIRTRAILSLHRVCQIAPEKVHPLLISLAGNVADRPEIRMAAIGLLFYSNAPLAIWQKFAAMTWFEPSRQVSTYIHSLIHSLSNIKPSTAFHRDLSEKAGIASGMVKPASFGLPYSFHDIRSSYLDEGLFVNMDTSSIRIADEHWPVVLANRYFYQFGPFTSEPLTIFLWNYNMGEIWQNIFGKIFGSLYSNQEMPGLTSLLSGNVREKVSSAVKSIWEQLETTRRPVDKRAGVLHFNLMSSINYVFDLENLEEKIPIWMRQAMKSQSGKPMDVSVTKYRMLAEYDVRFPTELGLPMRFLATLPILVSLQGTVNGDGKGGIKSEVAAELSWKLSSEISVELPFNGNYIATGVDVRVESRAPKSLNWSWSNGALKVACTPDSEITDLFYYHVKPFTITRNVIENFKPGLEDHQSVHLIKTDKQPFKSDYSLGDRWGIDIHLLTEGEMNWFDKAAWIQWFNKWDANGISNLGFVPLNIRHREFALRYKSEGTRARVIHWWFQYQYATKSSQKTVVFQTGATQSTTPSNPEVISYNQIVPQFKPTMERLFRNVDSGNVHLFRTGLTAELKDGTSVHLKSILGLSKDAWYTKDFTDFRLEKYTQTGTDSEKNVDYAVCYWAVRNWNKPPTYGFSKDVLFLTDDESIAFGEHCDQSKIHFNAKVYRDDWAANFALNSAAGQQCQKDMANGWKYGSPACTEARRLDQTYNVYEMSAEAKSSLPKPLFNWLNSARVWINRAVYPFTVEQTPSNGTNSPDHAFWNVRYNPATGYSNMTWVRPMETVVAHNVRFSDDYVPFSPLSFNFYKVFYPLSAGKNFIHDATNIATNGASQSECYVGSNSVYTYDSAFYNYTIDQCHHVLMTDCYRESDLAITAQTLEDRKIVHVYFDNDKIELDPNGFVTINGAKTAFNTLDKESRFEIRYNNNKEIKAVVYPLGESVIMEFRNGSSSMHGFLYVKVQGSHVQLTAPRHLGGRICGLCGDYNQETTKEFKTPKRCTVSQGELMATSFKLNAGEGCSARQNDDLSRRLKMETETCDSVDQFYSTYLPEIDLNKPTKCTVYEKYTYESTDLKGQCESTKVYPKCKPGCKPYMIIDKPITFKCSGGNSLKNITSMIRIPTSCITF